MNSFFYFSRNLEKKFFLSIKKILEDLQYFALSGYGEIHKFAIAKSWALNIVKYVPYLP